ncbi:hypothetical protein MRX96_051398 [Rhipicephalus microplus]
MFDYQAWIGTSMSTAANARNQSQRPFGDDGRHPWPPQARQTSSLQKCSSYFATEHEFAEEVANRYDTLGGRSDKGIWKGDRRDGLHRKADSSKGTRATRAQNTLLPYQNCGT